MSFQPPEKRRKTDSTGTEKLPDDCWEDDVFTANDLENIDEMVQLSQSINSAQINIDSNHNRNNAQKDYKKTVGRGMPKSHSSSEIQGFHARPSLNAGPGYLTAQGKGNHQTLQSSTKGMKTGPYQIPATRTSKQVSITGKEPNESKQTTNLREQLEVCKKELKELKEMDRNKSGQIKVLRSKLDAQQTKRIEIHQQVVSEKSAREKQLVSDKESLQVQLNFKEQELSELKIACRKLEQKLSSNTASSAKPTIPHSPKPCTSKGSRSPRTPKSGGFPNKETFLAEENCSAKNYIRPASLKFDKKNDFCTTESKLSKKQNFKFHVKKNKDELDALKVLDAILFGDMASSDQDCNGLLHLLNFPQLPKEVHKFKVDIKEQSFSQTRTNKVLHLLKAKLPSNSSRKISLPPIITQEIYSLAVTGVSLMLRSCSLTQENCIRRPLKWLSTELAILLLPLLDRYLAVYIYLNQKSVLASSPGVNNIGSSSSGSAMSSIDSLTSSVRSLMLKGANVSELLENCAKSSLQVLAKLITWSPHVRSALMSDPVDRSSSLQKSHETSLRRNLNFTEAKTQNTNEVKNMNESRNVSDVSDLIGPETYLDKDPSHLLSDSLPNGYMHKLLNQIVNKCQIRRHLIKLAANNTDTETAKGTVLSLQILASLVSSCQTQEHYERFLPIIDVVLTNLSEENKFDKSEYFHVLDWSLGILISLSSNMAMIKSFCQGNNENCTLMAVYNLHHALQGYDDLKLKSQITHKFVFLLSNIVERHKNGLTVLFDTNCKCSLELVKSLISVLHEELLRWRCNEEIRSSSFLRQGATLLHMIAGMDKLYQKHRQGLECQYRELLCGLDVVIRDANLEHVGLVGVVCDSNMEREAAVLHERSVWDFEANYPRSRLSGKTTESQ